MIDQKRTWARRQLYRKTYSWTAHTNVFRKCGTIDFTGRVNDKHLGMHTRGVEFFMESRGKKIQIVPERRAGVWYWKVLRGSPCE